MAAPKQTYVFLAHISALREFYTTFKGDCSRGEKYTLNRLDRQLKQTEDFFKKQGLLDNEDYDRLVELIVEDMCNVNVIEDGYS